MSKISSYPNNPSPDNSFMFIGTDPANETESSTGTTETVTLATLAEVIGGESGMANPMTTEGDLIVGGVSGTPARLAAGTSGYVLTAHGTGAAPTWAVSSGGGGGGGSDVPTANVIWMDNLGADHTGTTSVTSLFNTQLAAQGGAACLFVFGPGTFLWSTAPNNLGKDQSVMGFGSRVTNFNWSGSGPLFTATEAASSETWTGDDNAGSFSGFSITGPYGSGATSGIKYGALQGIRIDDVGFYGLPSGAVIGYNVTSGVDWAEEAQMTRLDISECGATSTYVFGFSGTSFDYSRIDALVVVEPNIDVIALNAAEMQGLNLSIRGNLHGGTSNTGAIISMDRASSSTASIIGGGDFSVSMEADDSSAGGTGDVGHYNLLMNSTSAASQFQAEGTFFAYPEGSCLPQGWANENNDPCAFSGFTNARNGTAPAQGVGLTVLGGTRLDPGGDGFGAPYDNTVFWEFGDIQTMTLGTGTTSLTFDGTDDFIIRGTIFFKATATGTATVTGASGTTIIWGTALPSLTSGHVYEVQCTYFPAENNWRLTYLTSYAS